MDILHFKSLQRPNLHLPKGPLQDWLFPSAALSAVVLLCLFAGVVFYLALVLLAALHAW